MKQNLRSFKRSLAFLSVGFLISSCGRDLPSLKKVEEAVGSLNIAASDISKDMYSSCIRATKFYGTPASPTVFTERKLGEDFCDDNYLQISSVMEDANQILINYMNVLVLLAKGESQKGKPISFDESYQNLENSLINLKFSSSSKAQLQAVFKAEEVNAGVAIAKFLTNLFTKETRRQNLKQAILCTNSDIQAYIKGKDAAEGQPEPGGLIAITNKVYVKGLLAEEERSIRTYFSEYIAILEDELKKNPLGFLAVEENYNNAMDLVRERKQKAQIYTEIIRNLASLHASLTEEFAKDSDAPLTGEKFDNYCKSLFQPFKTKTLDKVQTQEETKPETMRRVQAITIKHMQVLKPLLQKLKQ